MPARLLFVVVLGLAQTVATVSPVRGTETLPFDPDDPAIWVNARNPRESLIFGTIKVAAPDGGVAVFGLDGRLRQTLGPIDRPNNVDVEYGLTLGGVPTDVAVVTERYARRLRAFAIEDEGRAVRDVSSPSLEILTGAPGEEGAPMGVSLYKRPRDGAVFAIVAPKAGPADGYLWQYRLEDDGSGRVGARFVRRFGTFSGTGEIEAVAVDDDLGFVYYADEQHAIHKWHADPEHVDAAKELAVFGTEGYVQDREGLAIYSMPGGRGYLVSVDQLPGESVFHLYKREGEPGRPHDHTTTVKRVRLGADSTDGLDVTSTTLGPEFAGGLLVAMNSTSRNFLLVRWSDLAGAGEPKLQVRLP